MTVAVRLPFLLHGDRFFDSDEAVEGLMARHLLQGEPAAYLWGQHYKGVPEVYLAGLFFLVAGPSVIALKAATLACFAAFVCLQFVLIAELFSTRIAWMTTALTVVGPPSLVLWSLSGNAEIVMTLMAGAVMGLGLERWRRTGSLTACAVAGAAVGFGFWVQQYIVYYLAALAVVAVYELPARGDRLRTLLAARELPAWVRIPLHFVLAIALAYLVLGLMAFLTGGLDVQVVGWTIGLRHPQKLWRIAAGLSALYGGARIGLSLTEKGGLRAAAVPLAWLGGVVIGYAPALASQLRESGSAPIARMDLQGARSAMGPIVSDVMPIVFGFRSPTTEWLPVPGWLALVMVVTLVAAYAALRGRRTTPFFHVLFLLVPLLFVASGSFVDAQSYRYLMPVYAAVPALFAVGIDAMYRWKAVLGATVLSVLLGVFAVQQAAWYLRLTPDAESAAALRCLDVEGIRGALADYWLSYKLTFLANERIIVAPSDGVDRYPAFTSFVRSQPALVTIRRPASGTAAGNQPCDSILVQ